MMQLIASNHEERSLKTLDLSMKERKNKHGHYRMLNKFDLTVRRGE